MTNPFDPQLGNRTNSFPVFSDGKYTTIGKDGFTGTEMQLLVDTAQNIEFNHLGVVAQSVSRSGRLYTQKRNFAKPWSFKITPSPVYPWQGWRDEFETIWNKDKDGEHAIRMLTPVDYSPNASVYAGEFDPFVYRGTAARSEYIFAGDGDAWGGRSYEVLDDVTITAIDGNTMTIDVTNVPINTWILKRGDLIQPAGRTAGLNRPYRYPYVVVDIINDTGAVNSFNKFAGETVKYVKLNRAFIAQTYDPITDTVDSYDPLSSATDQNKLIVGGTCLFYVKVTKFPEVSWAPGKMITFNGDFELLENIV